jgi:hypothetical protein
VWNGHETIGAGRNHFPAFSKFSGNRRSLYSLWVLENDDQQVLRGLLLRCAMREEFASYSFLAVTIAGIVLLCSGLVALALT